MKNLIVVLIFGLIVSACNSKSNSDSKDQTVNSEIAALKTIELHVSGMTCEGCEHSVETALTGVKGVISAEASHQKAITVISYDSTLVKPELLAETIDGLGYHVEK